MEQGVTPLKELQNATKAVPDQSGSATTPNGNSSRREIEVEPAIDGQSPKPDNSLPNAPLLTVSSLEEPSSGHERRHREKRLSSDGNVESRIDFELTRDKIVLLHRNIEDLKVRAKRSRIDRENLEDWYVTQLATGGTQAGDFGYDEGASSSYAGSVIRERYENRLREIEHALKETEKQVGKLAYVQSHLETHGLPRGVEFRGFVRELMKQRSRGHAPDAPTSASHSHKSKTHTGTSGEQSPENSQVSSPSHLSKRAQTIETSEPSNAQRIKLESIKQQQELHLQQQDALKKRITQDERSTSSSKSDKRSVPYLLAPHLVDPNRLKPVSSSDSLYQLEIKVNEHMANLTEQCNRGSSLNLLSMPGEGAVGSQLNLLSEEDPDTSQADGLYKGTEGNLSLSQHSKSKYSTKLKQVKTGFESFGKNIRRKTEQRFSKSKHPILDQTTSDQGLGTLPKRTVESNGSPSRSLLDDKRRNRSNTMFGGSIRAKNYIKRASSTSESNKFSNPSNNPTELKPLPHSKTEAACLTGYENAGAVESSKTDSSSGGAGSAHLAKANKKANSISGPLVGTSSNSLGKTPSDPILERILELLSPDAVNASSPGPNSSQVASGSSQDHQRLRKGGSSTSSVSTPPQPAFMSQQAAAIANLSMSRPHTMSLEQFNLCRAFTMMYVHQQTAMNLFTDTLNRQLTQTCELVNHMNRMQEHQQKQSELLDSIMLDLGSVKRDISTMEQVHNNHQLVVSAQVQALETRADEQRQGLQELQSDHKRLIESLQYNLQTKTQDLKDNVLTINNRFNILENSLEQMITKRVKDSPLMQKLADFVMSIVVALTSVVQLIIKMINACAAISENKIFAIVCYLAIFTILLFLSCPRLLEWFNKNVLPGF